MIRKPGSSSSIATSRPASASIKRGNLSDSNFLLSPDTKSATLYTHKSINNSRPSSASTINFSPSRPSSSTKVSSAITPSKTSLQRPKKNNSFLSTKDVIATNEFEGEKFKCANVDLSKQNIIIHVYDENKSAKRAFHCKRFLLVKEMEYFEIALANKLTQEVVEIDVHCDIDIFEWLMSFISRKSPVLEPKLVVSILISSNFLKMFQLQKQCLKFMKDNINDVVKVPIDMSCIKQELMIELSDLFSITELAKVKDSKDRLKSQLFFYKIQELFDQTNLEEEEIYKSISKKNESKKLPPSWTSLNRCANCGQIYVEFKPKTFEKNKVFGWENSLTNYCSKGKINVDFWGWIDIPHVKDYTFDINKYVSKMFLNLQSWIKTFWVLWGNIYHINCKNCFKLLSCKELLKTGCSKHFSIFSAKNLHLMSCCGLEEKYTFEPFSIDKGCSKSFHEPNFLNFPELKQIFLEFKTFMSSNFSVDHLENDSLSDINPKKFTFCKWEDFSTSEKEILKKNKIALTREKDQSTMQEWSEELFKRARK
ncbi:hypothetical protein HDU92_008558 [Lobulomyces angularis]|nr:hypothetical protein HDU92_008558 [Lobulomyces angularis]